MKKTILFISLSLLLSGCASNKNLTCKVKASGLNLMNSSFSKGKRSYDIVSKTYEGMLYKTPILVEFVSKDKAKNDTPLHSLFTTLSANKTCDVDWIISTFPDNEKELIKSLTVDAEKMKRYKEYQDLIKEARVYGEIKYKDHVIYLLEFTHLKGPNRKVLPVYVETKKGWKQTNSLVEDENYDLIYASYIAGTIAP